VVTSFTATLTVTDSIGQTATATVLISLNNTPPQVTITSPANLTRYPLGEDSMYALSALVNDAESSDGQLQYAWQTHLHHNNHSHSEPVDAAHTTTTVITPVGCDGNSYYYRVVLTVTDPGGLSTQAQVFLLPDCPNPAREESQLLASARLAATAGDDQAVDSLLLAARGLGSPASESVMLARRAMAVCGWLRNDHNWPAALALAQRTITRLANFSETSALDRAERLYWEALLEGEILDHKSRALTLMQQAAALKPGDARMAGPLLGWAQALAEFGR
jgi:hypothetical protein